MYLMEWLTGVLFFQAEINKCLECVKLARISFFRGLIQHVFSLLMVHWWLSIKVLQFPKSFHSPAGFLLPRPFSLSLSLSSHLHSIPSFFSSGHQSWLSFPLPACTSQRCVQAAPTQRWALKRVPFGQKYLGPHVGATLLKSEENMESVCLNRIAQGQGVLGNFLDLQLGAEGELKII